MLDPAIPPGERAEYLASRRVEESRQPEKSLTDARGACLKLSCIFLTCFSLYVLYKSGYEVYCQRIGLQGYLTHHLEEQRESQKEREIIRLSPKRKIPSFILPCLHMNVHLLPEKFHLYL
jgi:hypothetical protein